MRGHLGGDVSCRQCGVREGIRSSHAAPGGSPPPQLPPQGPPSPSSGSAVNGASSSCASVAAAETHPPAFPRSAWQAWCQARLSSCGKGGPDSQPSCGDRPACGSSAPPHRSAFLGKGINGAVRDRGPHRSAQGVRARPPQLFRSTAPGRPQAAGRPHTGTRNSPDLACPQRHARATLAVQHSVPSPGRSPSSTNPTRFTLH